MKKTKKLLIVATAMLLFSILCVSLTLAYVTDRRVVTNELHLGSNVSLSISENDIWSSKSTVLTPAFGNTWIEKNPVVINTGSEPCFVRVKITIGLDASGASTVYPIADFVELSALNTGWVIYSGDPAWNSKSELTVYYSSPLQPGASTPPVFDRFRLNRFTSSSQALLEGAFADFNINVVAQGVQSRDGASSYSDPKAAFDALYN